jgi:hypothetical protein
MNQKEQLANLLKEAKKYFTSEKYTTLVSLADNLLAQGNLDGCKEMLDRLPTRDMLLESLVAKLKGKSVYKTLEQIHESKDISVATKLKGLSSLVTHALIEIEKGNVEYKILLPALLETESQLIKNL